MCVPWFRNRFYGICHSFFSPLKVFLPRPEVPLPRFGQKRVLAGFESVFMAFAVHFLAHCRFFCVYRRYHSQDMGINVCWPALNLVLQHSPFFFSALVVILCRLNILLPRYGWKRVFAGFKIGFTVLAVHRLAIRRFFSSIEGTFASILPKTCTPAYKQVFRHSPFFF